MAKLIFIFIISAALIIVQGDENATNQNAPPPEPPHKGNSTTPPPTTPPPTTKPTTKPTPEPTTKPPSPPPTTKPPPSPPTTKPPTPPPTPAPLPPKPTEPSEGNWEFNDTTNATCIKIHFAVQIVIPYLHKARNTTYNATVNIPPSAHVSGGDCVSDKATENIEIQWLNADNAIDNIKLQFVQNVTAKNYQLQEINMNITADDVSFPGIEDKNPIILIHQSSEFTTSLLKSYKCDKEQILNLTDVSNNGRGWIHISHLQLQAFGNATNNEFYSAIDCEPTSTPDVVPIAVGCALAILVIVVLVAYLIGRKRRQARGYLSM